MYWDPPFFFFPFFFLRLELVTLEFTEADVALVPSVLAKDFSDSEPLATAEAVEEFSAPSSRVSELAC